MKKVLCCALVAAMLLCTNGCSGGGTALSDKALSVAKQAVEVADAYIDMEIDSDEAEEKLDALEEEMEYTDDLPAGDKSGDYVISTDLTLISHAILMDSIDNTSESYDKVVEARNSLAEDAGLKKR